MSFDNNYGLEKIILYDGGSIPFNYSLGVLANTLFYNSPMYHNFYINGTTTTPLLSISNTGATFTEIVRPFLMRKLQTTNYRYLRLSYLQF